MRESPDIDSSTPQYAARFRGAIGNWFLKVQSNALLQVLPNPIGQSALDVGGGHAQLVPTLNSRGLSVTVQGSDESCSQLLSLDECQFIVADLLNLPFDERQYDIVTCFRILPHMQNWQALIANLCRVARVAVIIDYPSKRSVNAIAPILFGAKKKIEGNTRPYTLFSECEIAREFARNGFVKSKEVRQFFAPMVLYRALKIVGLAAGLELLFKLLGLTKAFGSPVVASFVPAPN